MDINALKSYVDVDNSLRDYQRDNKLKVYEAWSSCNSVMLQMPTGTGKTRLFVSIIKDIFHLSTDEKQAYKVLVMVHRKELVDQIDEELGYRYGLAHGIIQSGDRERKKYPIQIASVQTLSRRLANWTDKEFDFIIVDEAHHITAKSYQQIIKAFPHAKLLGVTATPCRLNGQGFKGTFDTLILSPSVKQFIDDGYLSQYDYYSVARSSFIQREIDGIKKFSNGDYAEQELERICDNDRIRAQVVETYLKYADGKRGIVYTINKVHNQRLCEEFKTHGIKTVALDSDTPREIRDDSINEFKAGKIQIICNVNLFTEGFDCPDIEFVQLARPTKSLALYLQQVGRGLRISEGKEKTLFLDNVGLYNKFGFPSSRRHWRYHFDGKEDYKTIEEEEKREIENNEEGVKHKRQQNLEEGHEKVHLIQTSIEQDIINDRFEELLNIIDEYNAIYVKACDDAFSYYNYPGIKLVTHNVTKRLKVDTLVIDEETREVIHLLNNNEYNIKIKENDKIVGEERRKCKDIKELGEALGLEYSNKRFSMMPENVSKYLIKRFYDLNLNDEDIKGLLKYASDWKAPNKSKYTHEEGYNIYDMLCLIFVDDIRFSADITKSTKGFKKTLFCKFCSFII